MSGDRPILPKTIELLRENILDSMHPFRLKNADCGIWCDRDPKPIILYSGCLYATMQIVLSKERILKMVTSNPDKSILVQLAAIYARLGPVYRRFMRVSRGRLVDIMYKAMKILERLGFEVGCLKDEPYAGMLLYELGFLEDFKEYVNKVYEIFKKHGVEEVITLDPHVYEALKYIYPEYIGNYDLKVHNFIDLVISAYDEGRISFKNVDGEKIVFHDPCHYSKSKYRRIIDEPRYLLRAMGYEIVEPMRTREMSMCCGGPIETYFSTLAREVAKRRLKELKSLGTKYVAVACPICLTSFLSVSEGSNQIMDLVELIYERMV